MMALSLVTAATSDTHTHTPLAVTILILAVILLFGVALAGIAALRLLIWFSGRVDASGSPRFRSMVTSLLLRLRPDAIHAPDPKIDEELLEHGLGDIHGRDPLFDGEAVLAAARRCGFLTFVVRMGGEASTMSTFVTEHFWESALGKQLGNATGVQFFGPGAQTTARLPTTASNGSSAETPLEFGGVYPLDFSVREARIVNVQPASNGVDRITVRMGWVGNSAATGRYAQVLARQGRLQMQGDVVRRELKGWYDLEFVRDAADKTEPVLGGWRCPGCGAPYDSEFDVECGFCGAERAVSEGQWMLNSGWLVACPTGA